MSIADNTVLGECPPHVKSREEALTPTDAECYRQPTEGLEEYIFCEDSCAKPEYTCQLKKEFQDGLIYESCKKEGNIAPKCPQYNTNINR